MADKHKLKILEFINNDDAKRLAEYAEQHKISLVDLRWSKEHLMHKAVLAGAQAVLFFLRIKKLPVDTQDEEGRTPLHLAVLKNNYQFARTLVVGWKANVRIKDNEDNFPGDLATNQEMKELLPICNKSAKATLQPSIRIQQPTQIPPPSATFYQSSMAATLPQPSAPLPSDFNLPRTNLAHTNPFRDVLPQPLSPTNPFEDVPCQPLSPTNPFRDVPPQQPLSSTNPFRDAPLQRPSAANPFGNTSIFTPYLSSSEVSQYTPAVAQNSYVSNPLTQSSTLPLAQSVPPRNSFVPYGQPYLPSGNPFIPYGQPPSRLPEPYPTTPHISGINNDTTYVNKPY